MDTGSDRRKTKLCAMPRDAAPAAQLVGIEGLALLRGLHERTSALEERLAEVRDLVGPDAPGPGAGAGAPAPAVEADARAGYARWAESYDEPGNPIVELEQPVVWAMLGRLPAGRALDAACGTGRHARRLADLGHAVTGVDVTPEMLAHAREAVPEATFTEGDLAALPLGDGAFDVAVCGLALAHLADPAPAVAELARVLAPGGRLVISTLHPLQIHLGWHARFTGADGERGFVREHPHGHAVYLRAFRKAGLSVIDCAEPALGDAHVRAMRRVFAAIPAAALQAYRGLPAVLVWHLQRTG
jgi:SAM-dependent methyltransferase